MEYKQLDLIKVFNKLNKELNEVSKNVILNKIKELEPLDLNELEKSIDLETLFDYRKYRL